MVDRSSLLFKLICIDLLTIIIIIIISEEKVTGPPYNVIQLNKLTEIKQNTVEGRSINRLLGMAE